MENQDIFGFRKFLDQSKRREESNFKKENRPSSYAHFDSINNIE